MSPTPAHAARGYPHLEGRASASDALLGGHRLSIESYRERHVGAEDRQGVDRAASDARQWRECVLHEVGGHGEGDSLRSRRSACGGGHGMTPLQLLSEALRHQRSGAAHGGAEAELGWLHLGRVDDEGGHRVALEPDAVALAIRSEWDALTGDDCALVP